MEKKILKNFFITRTQIMKVKKVCNSQIMALSKDEVLGFLAKEEEGFKEHHSYYNNTGEGCPGDILEMELSYSIEEAK
jgi:hypothetical protein